MKKLLISILLGSPAVMAQETFTSVETNSTLTVILTQDSINSYSIDGSGQDKAAINAEIKGQKLIIKNQASSDKDAVIRVKMKDISEVVVSGTGDLKSEGPINSEHLEVTVSGTGDASLNVNSKSLKAQISGTGDLKLKGTADYMTARVSGAGDLHAYDLLTKTSTIVSSGAGDARVNVKDSMNAKVSGAGSIVYKGDPSQREVTISGAGSVRQAGEDGEELTIETSIENNDTTRIKWKGKKLIIIDNKDSSATKQTQKSSKPEKNKVWAGLELGVNGYFNSGGTLRTPVTSPFLELDYKKSYVINFNFLEHSFRLYKNYIMLTTGLGTQFSRYALDKDYTLVPGSDTLKGFLTGINYKKNLLKTNYLTAPLMIQFNTSQKVKKSFHLAAGVVAGYNFSTFSKQVYELGDERYKIKVKDDYQVNPFKLDATVRVGYGKFNVFATYAMTPLFDKQVAPELYPFTLGVKLIGL